MSKQKTSHNETQEPERLDLHAEGTGRGTSAAVTVRLRPSGEVVLARASGSENDDPVLGQFLGFLAHDIATHPGQLQWVSSDFVQRVQLLVGEVDVDLNAPLSEDDE